MTPDLIYDTKDIIPNQANPEVCAPRELCLGSRQQQSQHSLIFKVIGRQGHFVKLLVCSQESMCIWQCAQHGENIIQQQVSWTVQVMTMSETICNKALVSLLLA